MTRRSVPSLVATSREQMTFFDLHPIDPHEARFKVIATLFLLRELGAIEYRGARSAKAPGATGARSLPPTRPARMRARLVRPPRSC